MQSTEEFCKQSGLGALCGSASPKVIRGSAVVVQNGHDTTWFK